MSTKLVQGVGINDYEGVIYNSASSKHIPAYNTWVHMLMRCYSPRYLASHPTYRGCSVCLEWLSFSNFKAWHDDNYRPGFQLDKDIVIPGNKIYRPEACRYVPGYLNNLLTDAKAARGELPVGVSRDHNGYYMRCQAGNGHRIKRYHPTIEAAVADYARTKKAVVKAQVFRAFDEDGVKSDVCCALLNRNW